MEACNVLAERRELGRIDGARGHESVEFVARVELSHAHGMFEHLAGSVDAGESGVPLIVATPR